MINTQSQLKDLAKELYFKKVLVPEWRDNFIEKLATHEVVDNLHVYHCPYCSRVSYQPVAFEELNVAIFPKSVKNQIWLTNAHYDGCRGWD